MEINGRSMVFEEPSLGSMRYCEPEPEGWPEDEVEIEATDVFSGFFDKNRQRVFYTRQLQIMHEKQFFHWVTDRALKNLVEEGLIKTESRSLKHGTKIILYWHKGLRYYKTAAKKLISLVNKYSSEEFGRLLGDTGEMLVLEGFARSKFVMAGRNTRRYEDREYTETEHDLDFIFERDGKAYGVEVKNTLGYMDQDELKIKIRLCQHLRIRPVFVVRMLPKNWINDLRLQGGFALVLEWHLYPLAHKALADRVREDIGILADAPRVLAEGTIRRFLNWHEKNV